MQARIFADDWGFATCEKYSFALNKPSPYPDVSRHGSPESNISDEEISICPEYRYVTELKAEYNDC